MVNDVRTEVSDIIIKMALDKNRQLIPLLMFVKEHENDEKGISREKVVKHMQKEDLSSRITTLNMINALLQEEILIDKKTKNYESNLKINPKFDFSRLLLDAIHFQLQDLQNALKPFEKIIKDKKVKVDFKRDEEKDKDTFEVTLTPTVN
jgi:tetratricopeptide (TPR) repeat protein